MRRAQHDGQTVTAGPRAPQRATCPGCQHPVTLRQRREPFGPGLVWYYVHDRGGPLDCPRRGQAYATGKRQSLPLRPYYELKKGDMRYEIRVTPGPIKGSWAVKCTWYKVGVKIIGRLKKVFWDEDDTREHVRRCLRRVTVKRGYVLVGGKDEAPTQGRRLHLERP